MIYTSYYAGLSKLPEGAEIYSISNSCPIESLHKIVELVPDWNFIVKPYKDGIINENEYTKRYKKQLDDLPREFKLRLLEEAKDKDSVTIFLCYEKPINFCHREILAEWLNNILKENLVTEYGYGF